MRWIMRGGSFREILPHHKETPAVLNQEQPVYLRFFFYFLHGLHQ